MSSTSPVLADARLRGHRRQELAHVSKTDEITRHHAIRYEPINYTRPPDSARNTAARDRISIIALSAVGPPCSLSWRGGSESDRVPPDLDQRLGLASKPIAKR